MSSKEEKKLNKKVLIVEDDRMLADMYVTKLKDLGIEAKAVYDGEACLEEVKKFKPDFILLDLILPMIDGFAVLKKLREDRETKDIVVVALSNLGQDEDIRKAEKIGIEDYLVKSEYTPQEVVNKVFNMLKNI